MGLFSSLFHSLFDVSTSSESTLPAGKSNNSSFNGHFSDYDQLYSDSSDCNLNYSDYVFSGKFTQTGKMRTKRSIRVFSGEDVLSRIMDLGYEDPISYSRLTPTSPSNSQMDYLSDLAMERDEVVPSALSSTDASALISRYVDRDSIPNPELFQYADEMHISVSYYTGKRMLYDTVFAQLDSFTRTAFFIFCVCRDVDHCMTGNLNDCPYKELFYSFSESVKEDTKFQKSLNDNYSGSDLRFFGSRYFKELGYSLSGGSKRTYAYKHARDFLIENRLISDV